MKKIIDEKNYLKENSKLSNGKVSLVSMKDSNSVFKGLLTLVFFISFATYLVPNPNQLKLGEIGELFNNIRVVCVSFLLIFMYLRIKIIYKKSKPWKYGLEYSIYFYAVFILFSLNALSTGYIMTIYLFGSEFTYFLINLIIALISVFMYLIKFSKRSLKVKEIDGEKEENNLIKYQMIGGISAGVVYFISNPQDNVIMYIAVMLLPILFSFCVAPFLFNLYAIKYRKDINFDEYYKILDQIDTSKEYPKNFFNVQKKKK